MRFAAVAFGRGQVLPDVQGSSYSASERSPVTRELLHQRSVLVMERKRRPPAICPSSAAPGAINHVHERILVELFDGYSVRCTCKRTLFASMEHLRIAILSLAKQTPAGKSRHEQDPSCFDRSMLA